MTHADDDGMIMPPRIAPYQVVILPFIKDDADTPAIMKACEEMRASLKAAGISAQIDKTDARSSDKMWAAIKKGVPVRLEIGARELAEGKVSFNRRDLGKDGKQIASIADAPEMVKAALDQMHTDMLASARTRLSRMLHDVASVEELRAFFADDKTGGVRIDYTLVHGSAEYEAVAKEFSLTKRCLPFDAPGKVIIAKAY
jgi:prolyl-tRNA synthetase